MDEPYKEVINAASKINSGITIYITGNNKKRFSQLTNSIPSNVKFTGYLDESDYIDLLCSCSGIMVLTYRKNCLLCGAYESVALKKPLILSNTPVLKELFHKGTMFTENTSEDISRCITELFFNIDVLKKEIVELDQALRLEERKRIELLKNIINLK